MSTTTDPGHDQHARDYPRDRQRQPGDHDTHRRGPDPTEGPSAPEAIRASRVTHRHRDDKMMAADAARRARGVEWVRPTDLLARQSATLAGRGIDFEVELARRTRQLTRTGGRGLGEVARTVSDRARRLPDVSEFGRGSRHSWWVSRTGIGLG
ncbi:hypothetical protein [Auritidibacter sp. NML100628]|uniref:hypothetical protein n=1 Tax=Auritidibacter sp. NML100628 TaxID=2170742 RepID=UPI000D73929D|nr:hypothetical protein [Auritidibacter sp. NML100628]PXA75706.1 hypothetical protein DCC24_09935 [Auritidibacter sp. NML100628]